MAERSDNTLLIFAHDNFELLIQVSTELTSSFKQEDVEYYNIMKHVGDGRYEQASLRGLSSGATRQGKNRRGLRLFIPITVL